MKKLLKVVVWIAGIFIVLVILAFIGLKLFFPAEKVRSLAVEKGSEYLGRNITVEGLDISIWGGLGVQLEKVSVSNPAGFEAENMLEADYVDVKLHLLPLLSGDFRVDKLVIEKPKIILRKRADGSNNYTFQAIEEKTPPEITEKTTPEARAAAATIAFDKLELNDAYLTYIDDSSNLNLNIVNLDLTTSLTIPGKGKYHSSGRLEIDSLILKNGMPIPELANIRLDYNAGYDIENEQIVLEETELDFNGMIFKLKGEIEHPLDKPVAKVNFKTDKISISKLLKFAPEDKLTILDDYKLAGDFSFDTDIEYDATRKEPLAYSGMALISDLSLSGEDIPGEFKFEKALVDFKSDNLRLNIEKGRLDGHPFKGHLTLNNFDDPEINGEIAGGLNLALLIPFLPEENKHELGGDAKFDLKFSGKIKEYEKMNYSGELSVTGGSYSSTILPEPVNSIEFDVYFDNDLLNVKKFSCKTSSAHLNFSGRFNDLVPYFLADSTRKVKIKPYVEGQLDGNLNLALLNGYLPPEGSPELKGKMQMELKLSGKVGDYAGFKPYGKMTITDAAYTDSLLPEPVEHFESVMSLTPDTIKIEKMEVKFTSSDASFSGKLSDPFPYLLPVASIDRSKIKRPYFNFSLSSKRFDVDRLFPEVAPGAVSDEGAAITSTPDSVSMIILPDIDGGGTMSVDTLIYSRVEFDHINGKIKIKDRKIECYDVTGNVYTGKVSGVTTIDLNDFEKPGYSGEFRANQIEADDFISRFTKFGGHLFGKFDINGSYSAYGWEPDTFMNSLTMNGVANMKEGKLVTSGAMYTALSKIAEAVGKSFEKEQPVKNLKSNIIVKDGRVKLDGLKSGLGSMGDVDIDGYYYFNGNLDYKGAVLLSEEWSSGLLSKGGVIGGLAGFLNDDSIDRLKLPLVINGTVNNPKVDVDYSSILNNAKGDVKDGAKKLLEGLFKKK